MIIIMTIIISASSSRIHHGNSEYHVRVLDIGAAGVGVGGCNVTGAGMGVDVGSGVDAGMDAVMGADVGAGVGVGVAGSRAGAGAGVGVGLGREALEVDAKPSLPPKL